jgi:hypothetical protein
MSDAGSHYPISQFLLRLLEEKNLSRSEFVVSLGYRYIERGRRRLDAWIDDGEGFDKIIGQIAKTYPNQADGLQAAIINTKAVKAAEDHAEFFDCCKSEAATFRPFIYAVGEKTVPSGICIFGISGGHEAWTIINIPQTILELPVEQQLLALPELMATYKQKFNGQVPFFGPLQEFRFVRLLDHFRFDADGRFIEHVEKPFRPGGVEISLR